MADNLLGEPLKKDPNLTTLVVNRLREAIANGALAPGTELSQVEIADLLQVSRVPVREALKQLEAEGLVLSRPYRKTVVSFLDSHRIIEQMEIRKALERLGLVQGIPMMTNAHFAEVEDILDQAESDGVAHEEWTQLNRLFHTQLYAVLDWPFLQGLIDGIQLNVGRYLRQQGKPVFREAVANQEHRAIVAACRTGNIAEAQRLMDDHIDATKMGLLKAVQASESATERPKGGSQQ